MKINGTLTKVEGLNVLIKKSEVPGPQGPKGDQGEPGTAPSLEEIINTLKEDNEFLRSLVSNKKWTFTIKRNSLGLIQEVLAESDY